MEVIAYKKLIRLFWVFLTMAIPNSSPVHASEVSLSVHPDQVVGRIDEKIYGHFLEHIYHSVNGGLWGDMIWNRTFEQADQTTAPAQFWKTYGPGRSLRDEENLLNGRFSVCVQTEGDESGIQQDALSVRMGEPLQGSVWIRGDAPSGLVARLLDGASILSEKALPSPKAEWREIPFHFRPDQISTNATLQIGVKGVGRVWIDQVSLMSEASKEVGGFRPDLLRAVAYIRPPVIRWPGGCFASHYRWKDAIGPQHERKIYPISLWDDQDVNSLGTDEFISLCRRVGAKPLIVVNIGSYASKEERRAYLQEVCDWIEYCNGPATSIMGKARAENGHPEPYGVKLWEIDNETWHQGAAVYSEAVKEFAPAMKHADPSIQLAVCGSCGLDMNWNREVLEGCGEHIDYLSIHHYEDPNRFAEGPRDYEKFFRELGPMIATSANPKMKIYVSEWNAQSTDWRTGLYAGGLLNAFERCCNYVEMAAPALFLRHVSAKEWNNAFINFDQSAWFPAPNYVVMKLWRDNFAPNLLAVTGETSPLNLVVTKSDHNEKLYLKAVNPTETEVHVQLTINGEKSYSRTTLSLVASDSLDARNAINEPRALTAKSAKTDFDGRTTSFIMPKRSAGVLEIE